MPINKALAFSVIAAFSIKCFLPEITAYFESEEGKELLKSLGIKGDYVGIGHCVLGYVDGEYPEIPERKPNWVYNID